MNITIVLLILALVLCVMDLIRQQFNSLGGFALLIVILVLLLSQLNVT